MTIPIAMIIGVYMFRIKRRCSFGSIAGVIMVCAAVFIGPYVAESNIAGWFTFNKNQLSLFCPIYGFGPPSVWLFLAPRITSALL